MEQSKAPSSNPTQPPANAEPTTARAKQEATATPDTAEQQVPTVYYIDGYHGGVAGHMPLGAVRDVIRELEHKPWWRVCLEVEPFSWTPLRRRDPEAYRWLQESSRDQRPDAQIEFVSGAYAQPFCWAFNGESNIRQLIVGRQVIREHFPQVVIDTYAVQEPCWTSALPQILRSLGYVRASLKNPSTAWGGYTAGQDASVLHWVGPEGTSIPTVPRYACEDLVDCWRTEAQRPTADYAHKCLAQGVTHPTGMTFQDLGWAAHPNVSGGEVCFRFCTWREFFERYAPPPERSWHFSQEDIHVGLCWGATALQRLAQQVRSAENNLLIAEKMASMACLWAGERYAWPDEPLQEAWRQLMLAQHHDAWIVLLGREGREQWAWKGGAQTWYTDQIAAEIIAAAQETLAAGKGIDAQARLSTRWARVFNTLGAPREALAAIPMTTDPGTTGVRVLDAQGKEVPSQLVPSRRYQDESLGAAQVLVRARVPGMGYTTFRLQPVYGDEPLAQPANGVQARNLDDDTLLIESDLYRLKLDLAHGGVISSLYAIALDKEFADAQSERRLNEYCGFFPALGQWLSSADTPAKAEIVEHGPLRVRVKLQGHIGDHLFTATIAVTQGEPRIDCSMRVYWAGDVAKVVVGEAWDGTNTWASRRRPCYDTRFKLQAFFPVALAGRQQIYKNAAYDVCHSQLEDTFFNSWDQLKHNVVLHWVGVTDKVEQYGLALLTDHTTSYAHGVDYPLALTFAWSGWGLWGRFYALDGSQEMRYALVPHAGRWDQAGISLASAGWNEPLLPQLTEGEPPDTEQSLVSVSGQGIEVPTVLCEEGALLVRLYNGEGDNTERTISFGFHPAQVTLVELDGREIEPLDLVVGQDGRWGVRLALPRFGIRTLRVAYPA